MRNPSLPNHATLARLYVTSVMIGGRLLIGTQPNRTIVPKSNGMGRSLYRIRTKIVKGG